MASRAECVRVTCWDAATPAEDGAAAGREVEGPGPPLAACKCTPVADNELDDTGAPATLTTTFVVCTGGDTDVRSVRLGGGGIGLAGIGEVTARVLEIAGCELEICIGAAGAGAAAAAAAAAASRLGDANGNTLDAVVLSAASTSAGTANELDVASGCLRCPPTGPASAAPPRPAVLISADPLAA